MATPDHALEPPSLVGMYKNNNVELFDILKINQYLALVYKLPRPVCLTDVTGAIIKNKRGN